MNDKLQAAAGEFLSSEQGQMLISQKDKLGSLVSSPDGESVKKMLSGDDIKKAAESGDMTKLSAVIGSVLATQEGKRLAAQIEKLIK